MQEFKGNRMINIREYYEKDGEMLPGKKVSAFLILCILSSNVLKWHPSCGSGTLYHAMLIPTPFTGHFPPHGAI